MPQREVFDFAFIDAEKGGYPEYYELVVARTRPGGLIMVDNVLADGLVVGGQADDGSEQVEAIRRTNETIVGDDRVDAAMLAVADGVVLARKR
jgi:caffeoyl-CoA O-methyltransferase